MNEKFKPADQLLPYQRDWVDDHSRWKFGLMARQVGKDFSSGFEGMAECALAECTGQKIDWLIASPSERQLLESLEKWKTWAEAFNLALADEQELREEKDLEAEFWRWIGKEEHRDKILDRLLTREQHDQEIERRNEEKRRRVREILGIH